MNITLPKLFMLAIGGFLVIAVIVGIGIFAFGRIVELVIRPLTAKVKEDTSNDKLIFLTLLVCFTMTALIVIGLGKLKVIRDGILNTWNFNSDSMWCYNKACG